MSSVLAISDILNVSSITITHINLDNHNCIGHTSEIKSYYLIFPQKKAKNNNFFI